MSNRESADQELRCAACGDGFVFSAGEQELYRLRGITSHPERCPSCARARATTSPGETPAPPARRRG